jgi:hypothetical protein
MRPGEQAPALGEPCVVALLLEHRHRADDRLGRLVSPALGVAGAQQNEQPHEGRMGLDAGETRGSRPLDRLVEYLGGLREVPRLQQNLAVLG